MSFHKSVMGRGVLSDNAKTLSDVIDRVQKADEYLNVVNNSHFRKASCLHWEAFQELKKMNMSDEQAKDWMHSWWTQLSSLPETD